MLYAPPQLTSADLRVLADLEEMRHHLCVHLRKEEQWIRQLRRSLTARAVVGSNTIEGCAASIDDTEALMAGEAPLETNDVTRRERVNHQRAMTCIQALPDAGAEFRYDLGLLNGLHFMMQEPHTRKRPGRLRTMPIYIRSADDPIVAACRGPDPGLVTGLMDELVRWLNEGDLDAPVHVRASMAHLNLVMIHPGPTGTGACRERCPRWCSPGRPCCRRSSPPSRSGCFRPSGRRAYGGPCTSRMPASARSRPCASPNL
ncbi:hypothetical protein GCM10009733_026940 [Nonomuraea maheshkhaliensis]|uniref:Uncharacterized protein n=1 Tax=Nonomuraea maheshkhaliensis TaxID=419590 RepID=A0ABN2F3A1_9ACTN